MIKYPKIETPFNRDIEGTKKLVMNDWRNSAVKYLQFNDWIWTEKIDGTNTRIFWDGHTVFFGGRTDQAQLPSTLVNKLCEIFKTDEAEELFEQTFGDTPVTLFGEGYGGKIQAVGPLYGDVNFRLFDAYIESSKRWINFNNICQIAKMFNISTVPYIGMGTIAEAIEYVQSKPQSTIGNCTMEGLVCKPNIELLDSAGNRVIVKIKVKDFT